MDELAKNYPQTSGLGTVGQAERDDVTLRQNIDAKIERHKQAIIELEAMKDELVTLLDMRIDRLRAAMSGGRY